MRRSKWVIAIWLVSLTFSFHVADGERRDEQPQDDDLSLAALMLPSDSQASDQPNIAVPGQDVDPDFLDVHSPILVSQLTGAKSPSRTEEPWNIYGTDLGFTFEDDNTIYMVFGDTWGRDGSEGEDWRSNIMVVVEPDPDHGYVISEVVANELGEAKELLESQKASGTEYTVIPTSGLMIDDRMYLHYMSIRDWDQKWWGYKEPIMNSSGFAYSDDGGQTWTKDETAAWEGDTAFSQAAMVQQGAYVYVYGTPAGRFGATRLMRVPTDDILEPASYTYWTGDEWSSDPVQAVEVVPAPVGELSVRWNSYHQRWFMMYKNEITHNVVLRTSPELTGPWDDERVVASSVDYPTLYAPFMLPIDGPDIYFTMSLFKPDYQVFVMRVTADAAR